ncbi:DUF3137 domain-containing protein [Nocardioides sp. cx-169]|uniref:DUF3137 domain-containing protein n=1 Tax=Nocardioides sp. cx-169 TaxID=2899080 RepID=UPI001E3AE1CF|nr:DUF3137 domain-containing protein [Nocardioides sp. cx-169]MCD4535165.1 DUF3137 domain-containing protein [Nocardioides sp. cx-169]
MLTSLFGGSFGLLFLGFTALVIVVFVVSLVQAKRRREGMTAFAAARGWTYRESDDSLVTRFSGDPFGTGSSRRATNCLYGAHDGRPMVAFDYRYTTSSGTGDDHSTETHTYSVVAMSLGVPVPPLAVSPEGPVGRFFGRLTNRDIELESEDFNRAFTVLAHDRRFASDVLHPQMMQMLLQWPALGWRFEGDSMLVVRAGDHEPHEVDATLAVMDAILDRVPEHVWRTLRGQ